MVRTELSPGAPPKVEKELQRKTQNKENNKTGNVENYHIAVLPGDGIGGSHGAKP